MRWGDTRSAVAALMNVVYTIGLEGMTGTESAAILDVLFAQARRVSLTCPGPLGARHPRHVG